MQRRDSTPSRQRGFALLDALIAFLVLTLGMLAVMRLQSGVRQHSEIARQRSEAVRIAQQDIESLRGFAVLSPTPGLPSFDEIDDATRTVDTPLGAGGTRYVLERQIATTGPAKALGVRVRWSDRTGASQQLTLQTLIAGIDPALGAALALKRSGGAALGPLGRSVRIPLVSKDLGDGRSALKPVASGTVALLFDNHSGQVIGRCSGVAAAVSTSALASSDLLGCDANVGRLLSGVVRFSDASPPDAAHANDAPMPLSVEITSSVPWGIAPACDSETVKTVRYTVAGTLHIDTLPLNALPASVGVTGWSGPGERAVAYHCVVYPTDGTAWTGRASLLPTGWHIGTGPGDHRVCRYSGDLDRSGAIDANIEHPAAYVAVANALPQQNYLVVNGNESCPGGSSIRVAGTSTDVFADLATVQHQP